MDVVRRDSAARALLVWARTTTNGAQVEVAEDEDAFLCPGWVLGRHLGAGTHLVVADASQPVVIYFVRRGPLAVQVKGQISGLFKGAEAELQYTMTAAVRAAEPATLCHEVLPLPHENIGTGVQRSVTASLGRCLQHAIACAGAMAAEPLLTLFRGQDPMAGAVRGIELVRIETLTVATAERPLLEWSAADGAASTSRHALGERSAGGADAVPREVSRAPTQQAHAVAPPPPSGARHQNGSDVLVYWRDGLWHSATVEAYRAGQYRVAVDTGEVLWVPGEQVRGS